MIDPWLSEAISNNAAWCSAVAASHNITSRWHQQVWFSQYPMPPLYPNIVTLDSGVEVDEQIRAIDPQLPVGWGIKDSYKELQLTGSGFKAAFEACWYCREPGGTTNRKSPGARVKYVSSQSELNRWINAWGEKIEIFKPSLLLNDDIELLYAEKDGQLVSGLVTNRSGESVGLSNLFGQPDGILDCIDSVGERYPGRGIVGYGDKAEIAALSKVGFREIGELQVWLRMN